jgi:hypothetical protein
MTRIVTVLAVLTIIAHFIRPFGLPGLKRRKDVWKIAVAGFVIVMAAALAREL